MISHDFAYDRKDNTGAVAVNCFLYSEERGGRLLEEKSFERTKYFVLAFCVAFLVLMLIAMVVLLNLKKPPEAQQSGMEEANRPADDYYIPAAQDNLNILLIGTEKDGEAPLYFFLCRLDVEDGAIPVATLPPQTVVRYAGKTATLAELYGRSGVKAVKQALGELLEIQVDRYVVFNKESLVKAVDMIGFIEYDLPQPLEYKGKDKTINLSAGRQMVDGRKFYDILSFPGYATQERRATASSDLISAYINARLEVVLSAQADALFKSVINLMESDLSFEDYDSRKEALAFLAKLSGRHARTVLVRGGFNTAGDSFSFSQSCGETLHKLYL